MPASSHDLTRLIVESGTSSPDLITTVLPQTRAGISFQDGIAIGKLNGGTIEVSSSEGKGSVFSFSVPIYATVAGKLQANDYTNAGLIASNQGWIKNHAKFKG